MGQDGTRRNRPGDSQFPALGTWRPSTGTEAQEEAVMGETVMIFRQPYCAYSCRLIVI